MISRSNTMSSPPGPYCGGHPLELIAVFRRWPRSPWRNALYTVIWSSMIGVVLAVIQAVFRNSGSMVDFLLPMLVVSNVVGALIHGGLAGADALLRGWPRRQTGAVRLLYYLAIVSLLVVAGIAIGNALYQGKNPLPALARYGTVTALLPFAVATAVLMFVVNDAGERRARAELEAMRQREDMAEAAQLLAETRLRALQAQIEPHFLYNTLANVLSLIDSEPAQARHMLERFIDFLRASLHASRAEHATVGAELDLAAAYLDILAVRMGPRLRYRIEADGAARACAIAPMLLQPLVENAVMHGLEPKIEGGTIVLQARLAQDLLVLEVGDDGVGIGNAPPRAGGGVGLANLKARLRSLHGAGAQVQLLDKPDGGALVRLLLPTTEVMPSTLPRTPPP
jgi:signal transduction histidine kinase